MKKALSILIILTLTFSLIAGFHASSAKAADPLNPIGLRKSISENLKNLTISEEAKQKAESLKLPTELIDGVEIPKSLIETKQIKNGEAYVKVTIGGVNKPALGYAKENNISINVVTLDPADKAKVVSYIDTLKAEHSSIKNQLAGLPVTVKKDLYITYNGVIVETQIKNIKDLYARFGKERVHIETIYTIDLNYSVPLINADDVWTDPGVDGTDMYVGVIDTGVDYTHPDLGGGWGTKVVAGYDFGDDDTNPMDCNGHGTHVSGIMAADGTLKGVAPKAKIVIGKIVAGCAGSASSTDIADAFDYMADPNNLDSGPEGTHPPVASVNMSFGSQAGFVTTEEPEQAAIEACVASGIFVSLSAGNSYYSYYPYGYYPFFPDYALVGSPSVTPSAISVAASYNTYGKYPALTELSSSQIYAYTVGGDSPDPVSALGDNSGSGYKYYYCGLGGSAGDFPPEVSGNIALIQRGTYTFATKIHNAAAAGAIGAIIYNSAAGGDILLSMATSGETLPSVFIGRTAGIALYAKSENSGDGTGRVAFYSGTFTDSPLPGDTMVEFSSWGPAPDLSFKPEITAPGGGIWSTVPGGGYDNYSGTSMAAPHVGAAAALIKEAHSDWSSAQIKIALMNTAKILIEPATGRPYSVLKMGAGRVDVYNALHTDVLATDSSKGTPYVALGELPSYKSAPVVFTVRLTNTGASGVNYNISSTIQTTNFNLTSRGLTGATVTTIPSGSVIVPAGGTTDVVVMIDATAVADWTGFNYLEGFIKFTPSSGVELHIPYMGVLGKWNQFTDENAWDFNPLIDPAADDPMNFTQYLYGTGATWPEVTDNANWYYAGVDYYGNLDRNAIAFNPNYVLLETDFWALRNIQNVTIEIRDQSNNLVKTIDSTDYIYKMIPDYGLGWYYYDIYDYDWWVWDGTDSGNNPVSDGYYKLVIIATPPKLHNKLTYDAPQVIEFPVSLDTVDPSIDIESIVDNGDDTYTISWTNVSDPAPSSGIWGYAIVLNGDYNNAIFIPPTQSSTTISGLLHGSNSIEVVAIDNAMNGGSDTESYDLYKITSSSTSGGTISPLGEILVGEGEDKSFVITANSNYHIADIIVDGSSDMPDSLRKSIDTISYTYTFENVDGDHTIHAVFAPGILEYSITATAYMGGAISPSGTISILQFGSQTYTITPDVNYHVLDVFVDDVSQGPITEYTFENVHDNHIIEAFFLHNYFKTTYPVGDEVFSTLDTIHVTWDVEGFVGTEGKVRVLFYNGQSWSIVAQNLDLVDSFFDITLSDKTIIDPLRCRVRAGIYDPGTGNWLTWGTGNQYYDESGHFWVLPPGNGFPYFKTTLPLGNELFFPDDTIHVTWDVNGFAGTEGKVRVLFYNGSTWEIVAANLDLADGFFDLDLTGKTIVDPLRCRVRAGIYDPATGNWLTWGTNGQYYDESGHFWVLYQEIPV